MVNCNGFHLGAIDLFCQQETKEKGRHACNEKEKTQFNWWLVFPHGWIIKMLLAGETLKIFLLSGISMKKNKKKCLSEEKNVVVYIYIELKLASPNLAYKNKKSKKT